MRIIWTCFLSLIFFTSCQTEDPSSTQEVPAIPVIASVPERQDIPVYIETIGSLRPSIHIEVRPQVEGIITNILVSEGQGVEPGTPLFKIDSQSYEIKVQEAEAQLAIDYINLQAAQKKLDRFLSLAKKDLIPQTEWDDLEKQVSIAQSTLQGDQAKLVNAQLDLEHCTIQAATSGRIGKIDLYSGCIVTANQSTPLVAISQMDPLTVEFHLTEKEYLSLPSHQNPIFVQLLNNSDTSSQGNISFIDNQFDLKSGLILVRASIPNRSNTLRPGQYVRLLIPISTLHQALLIPQKAVKYSEQGPYVYIVNKDQMVEMRLVQLGKTQSDQIIVTEGLTPEDMVILEGHLRIFPGTKVKL